jgi:hypothetical protein
MAVGIVDTKITAVTVTVTVTVQASGFQASGFRLQASGMGLFYIRVNVKA